MNEKERLLGIVVKAKYDMEGLNWVPSKCSRPYGVGMWKFIIRERFFSHITSKVGDGSSIYLWHHNWCHGVLLTVRFPSLYGLGG